MIYALESQDLGKRYGGRWGLRHCDLQVEQGSIVGLVGRNGVGKTTLLHLATGLLKPTEGTIMVMGASVTKSVAVLPRIGFVPQEPALYPDFSIKDMLKTGKKLNPAWNEELAEELIDFCQLERRQHISNLSGGEKAKVALIMALCKRPELLLLDEPFASVDPLARREFSQVLMKAVANQVMTIVVSSHNVADLENICDHLIVLTPQGVRLAAEVEELLATHTLLIGPREAYDAIARMHKVVQVSHVGRQSSVLVRSSVPVVEPGWQEQSVTLEDIVLAYLAEREYRSMPQIPMQVMQGGVQ